LYFYFSLNGHRQQRWLRPVIISHRHKPFITNTIKMPPKDKTPPGETGPEARQMKDPDIIDRPSGSGFGSENPKQG